jgi:hypothetical protein
MATKSTGTAKLGADIRVPGMRCASLRMIPELDCKMLSFDAAEAMEIWWAFRSHLSQRQRSQVILT